MHVGGVAPRIQILIIGEEFELRLVVQPASRSVSVTKPCESGTRQYSDGIIQRSRADDEFVIVAAADPHWRHEIEAIRAVLRLRHRLRVQSEDYPREDRKPGLHAIARSS